MKKLTKNSKFESQKLGNIGKFRGKEGIFFSLAETVHILVLSETENRDMFIHIKHYTNKSYT